MKLIFRNIVSLILGLTVLVSTSGFTVFKHHCYTNNTTELSFIVEDFECDHQEHKDGHKLPPCCTLPERVPGTKYSEGDCCDTETHLYKLNITLDIQEVTKKTNPALIAGILITEYKPDLPAEEKDHIIISNDLPPPRSGKDLHIFLQQLNYDC